MFRHFVPFSTAVALFDILGYENVSTLQNVMPAASVLLSAAGLATEQVVTTEKKVSDMLFPEIYEAREWVSRV